MELNVWISFCYEGEMSSLLLLLLLRCLQIYSSYGINIKCAYQQTGWRTNRQSMLTVTSLRAHILSARLNVCCGGIALMRIQLNVAYVGMVLLRLLLVAFFLLFLWLAILARFVCCAMLYAHDNKFSTISRPDDDF